MNYMTIEKITRYIKIKHSRIRSPKKTQESNTQQKYYVDSLAISTQKEKEPKKQE
jgi:hypothetical protein